MKSFLCFSRNMEAYIFVRFTKLKEVCSCKKDGVISVEMAIFIFIGIVLASIFWGAAKKITNSAVTGAQNNASTLFE